jgi:acyl-CoA oxidase
MTPKFWEMHLDPNIALDYGLFTILAAQINLTVGTLSRYLTKRPDLAPLVDALLKGDVIGLYLLSERGHGLDDLNIETTAYQQDDGSYVLNTPNEEATKYVNPLFLHEVFTDSRPGLCRPRTQPLALTRSRSSWHA